MPVGLPNIIIQFLLIEIVLLLLLFSTQQILHLCFCITGDAASVVFLAARSRQQKYHRGRVKAAVYIPYFSILLGCKL